MNQAQRHYASLFRELERENGKLDPGTLTAIVGFSAGGPVSMNRIAGRQLYVTCELSLYPEQRRSSEGMKFELLSRAHLDESTSRSVFTALGNLSMNAQLGDGHTVDLSKVVSGPCTLVQLRLYSKGGPFWRKCGIYEVFPVRHHGA